MLGEEDAALALVMNAMLPIMLCKLLVALSVPNFSAAEKSPAVPLPNAKEAGASLEIPESPLKESTVPLGNCRELLRSTALVIVPATAGAVSVAVPLVVPARARIPLPPPATPMVRVVEPLVVRKVLVDGAVAAPPPRIGELAVCAAEVAHVDAEEK